METVERIKHKILLAGIRLRPSISEDDVEQFESTAGITLPDEYRDFLIYIGNGGVAPCRLLPLNHWNASYWMDTSGVTKYLCEPCKITPMAVEHGQHWLDNIGIHDWESRWDNNEWDPMFGTIAIAEIGCGLFYSLIINGEYRGRIFSWGDHALNPPYFVSQNNFMDWIEDSLDNSIKGRPVYFLDGRMR